MPFGMVEHAWTRLGVSEVLTVGLAFVQPVHATLGIRGAARRGGRGGRSGGFRLAAFSDAAAFRLLGYGAAVVRALGGVGRSNRCVMVDHAGCWRGASDQG
jgi:hypothetical protein